MLRCRPASRHGLIGLFFGLFLGLAPVAAWPQSDEPAAKTPQTPGRTGLPLPRFVTLRAPEVNMRTGPGIRYPIDWVYRRRGLPVEVIDEFETWRRIRDWQGTEGWVHQSMLKGERGALVIGKQRILRLEAEADSAGVAQVEAGVVGTLKRCRDDWCLVEFKGFEGWLRRDEFYGLYLDEMRG